MTLQEAHDLVVTLAYDRSDIDALLGASAGTDSTGAEVFRSYIVAGSLIRTSWQRYKSTRSASGASVEYKSGAEAWAALRALQANMDAANGVTAPEGWTASSDFRLTF